jgi:STE24 endopeptidase
MKSHSCLIFILLLYILKESFEYAVQYLNLVHMRRFGHAVPDEFKGEIDEGLMKKAQEYEVEHTRFGFLSSIFGNIVTVVFFFSGLLNVYNSWIVSLRLPFTLSGWLFFMILFYANEILFMPFSLYNTFKIENRYGFNTTTFKLWVSDLAKSLVLSMLLLSILLPAGLWLIELSPGFWWLWVWGFLFLFSMFVTYISPYLIEPLFNKFTPVEDLSLREGIIRLLEKAGIRADRILRVDASKRSLHTNAYFTGIGRTKRIVLYDTLLERMNKEEVLSVLAHEIGHWKKRHILKMIALFEVLSVIALYLSYRFMQGNYLTTLFHIKYDTFFAKALILAFLAGILILPLRPILNNYTRRHEKEADITSHELTNDSEGMIRALVKLSKDNLSNLYPHPLYVSLYYSHPPTLDRIRYIRGLAKKEE